MPVDRLSMIPALWRFPALGWLVLGVKLSHIQEISRIRCVF